MKARTTKKTHAQNGIGTAKKNAGQKGRAQWARGTQCKF